MFMNKMDTVAWLSCVFIYLAALVRSQVYLIDEILADGDPTVTLGRLSNQISMYEDELAICGNVANIFSYNKYSASFDVKQTITTPDASVGSEAWCEGIQISENYLIIADGGIGVIYIYKRDASSGSNLWYQYTSTSAVSGSSYYFGSALAMTPDAEYIFVGDFFASFERGGAYIYAKRVSEEGDESWPRTQSMSEASGTGYDSYYPSLFGSAIDVGSNNYAAISAPGDSNGNGAVYIYNLQYITGWDGSSYYSWVQVQKVTQPNGWSVSIDKNININRMIADGANIYDLNDESGVWENTVTLDEPNANPGTLSVSIDGDFAALGNGWNNFGSAGSFFVYNRVYDSDSDSDSYSWQLYDRVDADNQGDDFARGILMYNDWIIVGAYGSFVNDNGDTVNNVVYAYNLVNLTAVEPGLECDLIDNGDIGSIPLCDSDPCDCVLNEEDSLNCNVCNAGSGCSQCQGGYFKYNYNYQCTQCQDVFGDNCMFCSDFLGCQQCKSGSTRTFSEDCMLWYCA